MIINKYDKIINIIDNLKIKLLLICFRKYLMSITCNCIKNLEIEHLEIKNLA